MCVCCVCARVGGGVNSARPAPSELGPRCWPPRQHAGQHVISPNLAGHGVTRQMQSPKHARGWCPAPPLPCCTRTPPQPPPPTTRTTTPTTTTTTTFSADVSWQLPLVCPRGTMKPGHIHSGGAATWRSRCTAARFGAPMLRRCVDNSHGSGCGGTAALARRYMFMMTVACWPPTCQASGALDQMAFGCCVRVRMLPPDDVGSR